MKNLRKKIYRQIGLLLHAGRVKGGYTWRQNYSGWSPEIDFNQTQIAWGNAILELSVRLLFKICRNSRRSKKIPARKRAGK